MKLKIICTLTVLIGLCMTSCRNSEEVEDISHLGNNKNVSTRIEENIFKKDSTVVSLNDDDTKDPPKTGQQWKTKQ